MQCFLMLKESRDEDKVLEEVSVCVCVCVIESAGSVK